jgi:hypothetical protein
MRDLRSPTRFLLTIVASEAEIYANHPISGLLVSPVAIFRTRINRQLIRYHSPLKFYAMVQVFPQLYLLSGLGKPVNQNYCKTTTDDN